jgi:cytochrome c5
MTMSKNIMLVLGLGLLAFGCGKKTPPQEAKATPATTAAQTKPAAKTAEPAILAAVGGDAASLFRVRCSSCHGMSGKGDGPASASLNPKPRDFRDAGWRAEVTDEHIKKVIVGGGQAAGKSPLMAPNPDLKGQKAILDGLVKIIRGLK